MGMNPKNETNHREAKETKFHTFTTRSKKLEAKKGFL